MLTTYLLMFCRVTIAVLFTFSFSNKILALKDFVVTIGDFKLLPRRWSKIMALLFLCGEIVTAVLVTIGGILLPIGFLLAMVLLVIFSAALVMALRRNITMSCNCFGRTERHISRYDVVRNMIFILSSLIGLYLLRYVLWNIPGSMIILLTLMSVGLLMVATNLEDIVETLRQPFPVNEERR